MHIPKDVIIHTLIPYTSYFDLDALLNAFAFTRQEIAKLKAKEYKLRVSRVYINLNPNAVFSFGRYEWHIETKRHREDGPAVYNGWYKEYYYNDKLHRTDGPAVIYPDGGKEYYIHGKKHREDGPAVTHYNGGEEWWQHGKLHRTDGPAVFLPSGAIEWWIHGECVSFTNVRRRQKPVKQLVYVPRIQLPSKKLNNKHLKNKRLRY